MKEGSPGLLQAPVLGTENRVSQEQWENQGSQEGNPEKSDCGECLVELMEVPEYQDYLREGLVYREKLWEDLASLDLAGLVHQADLWESSASLDLEGQEYLWESLG